MTCIRVNVNRCTCPNMCMCMCVCVCVQGVQSASRLSGISHRSLRHDVVLRCGTERRHWTRALPATRGLFATPLHCICQFHPLLLSLTYYIFLTHSLVLLVLYRKCCSLVGLPLRDRMTTKTTILSMFSV